MAKGKFSGFGGGGGGMNMNNLMRQAQKMKEDMEKAEDELTQKEVESTTGGGAVRVVATGDKKIKQIQIDPELLDPQEAEMLMDMLLIAVNECLDKVEEMRTAELGKISGGMGKIPGF